MSLPATDMTTPASPWMPEIDTACRRIAPCWPLDRFIAVNPWWGYIEQPIEQATAEIAVLSGARTTITHTDGAEAPRARLPLLADIVDARRDLSHAMAWTDAITHQISQHCAAFFDTEQAGWGPERRLGLYRSWRQCISNDHGIRLLMGEGYVARRAHSLPDDALAAIDHVLALLGIPDDAVEHYLTAALHGVLGWASWCAYLRWQARLDGKDDANIVELLAVRLAWDALLDDGQRGSGSAHAGFMDAWRQRRARLEHALAQHRHDWTAQRAQERAYQDTLRTALQRTRATAPLNDAATPAAIQAVFCIDVRSEVIRRALESVDDGVATLGFAGFFGLPIGYTPLGTQASRPQLPGLLAPTLHATDVPDQTAAGQRLGELRCESLAVRARWADFRSSASSTFTFVESLGWSYAARLLKRSLPASGRAATVATTGLSQADARRLRPRMVLDGDAAAAADAGADVAARVLGAMGLRRDFARLVLLAGHGSQTENNPHAAGLDCGACGGQTGEVNSRALAALLNDAAVRAGLARRGVPIPDTTWFLAGQHNTTTDDTDLFDVDLMPASHAEDERRLRAALEAAAQRARAERAPRLGLEALVGRPAALTKAVRARANDWAQVRPEWGLADCAAFIVAPRARTRGMDLGGRSFLHDYDWTQDADNSVLELIMTAPMVVTHWISMQYYASTVDNPRYGSGNKLLHNVVGGRIGVFEGNGGDLRIGLPWQSVHDGTRFMHTPLRLSVFIEAPRERIDTVVTTHLTVRQLLANGWLHLLRIDPDTGTVDDYSMPT